MTTQKNVELMQDLSRGPTANIFNAIDQSIVRNALAKLQGHEHKIVILRFWEGNTISEIAEILDLTWQEVETYLAGALTKLKALCLADPEFSRSHRKGGLPCGNRAHSAA